MISRRGLIIGASSIAVAAALPVSALAQAGAQLPVRFRVSGDRYLRGAQRAAIISYPVIFVLGAKARSSRGGFGLGGARLEVTLDGPAEADLRALADEAYADLAARFSAAGIVPVPAEEVAADPNVTRIQRAPGNLVHGDGILDSRATKAWVGVSASAAPLLKGQGDAAAGAGELLLLGKLARPSDSLAALSVVPKLVIDFTNLNSTRRVVSVGAARVSGGIEFSIDQASTTHIVKGDGRGLMLPARLDMAGQVVSEVPLTGELVQDVAPPPMSIDTIFGRSRVDAFRVDMDPWREQVRAAYRGYNQAIVDAIKGAG